VSGEDMDVCELGTTSIMAAALPLPPTIGFNATTASLQASCPGRKYQRCFFHHLEAKYPVSQFRLPPLPPRCAKAKGEAALLDPACTLPPPERVLMPWAGPTLHRCPPPPPASAPAPRRRARLTCGQPGGDANAVLLLGVPSSPGPTGKLRREAIRASWMRDERVGTSVLVCFLLSARTPPEKLAPMREEHAAHGDILFLDAPETPWLVRNNTKYSGWRQKGRGMPTFKQYAFFQYAAAVHPRVPFVGKIDDDTAPNLRVLTPFLERLRCVDDGDGGASGGGEAYLFIGAINWASFVPRSSEFGVRGDRCGFGWSLHASLTNFGSSFGTPGTAGYIEACDTRGGVLPFPYGTGAGYLFSADLLRFVATSAEVSGWVADAASAGTRDVYQWQKFEDTSTGYFVAHAPRTVRYVDIGPLVHDVNCHVDGERKRRGGATYRPPANSSIFVHNLKGPSAFSFAWEHMQATTLPYDHERCVTQVWRGGHPRRGGGGAAAGGGGSGRRRRAGGRGRRERAIGGRDLQ
jgi:hypothetical protein